MNDAIDRPIGVFDSGFGGLTVLRSLVEQLPNEDFVYLGDTARAPYGPRSIAEVRRFALQGLDHLVEIADRALAHGAGQGAVGPDGLAALQQIAPDQVGRRQVVMAGDGVKRPVQPRRHMGERDARVGVVGGFGDGVEAPGTDVVPDLDLGGQGD